MFEAAPAPHPVPGATPTVAAPASPPGPVSIAILVPLSGSHADLGRDLLDAATMALFDSGREDVVLLPKDTGDESAATVAAAASAALAEGARIILGPVFAASVRTVGGLAKGARVPVIGFSSDTRVAGPGVFLLGHAPAQQIDRVVTFAANHGIDRLTVLAEDDEYGGAIAGAVRIAATERGVAMAEPGFIPADALDVAAAVREAANLETRPLIVATQLQMLAGRTDGGAVRARARLTGLDVSGATGYQAMVIAVSGERLRTVSALLPYFGLQPPAVRILGTAAWNTPAALADPALAGAWFAAPAADLRERFFTRFRDTFGRDALPIAPLAYDAVALAVALVNGGGLDTERLTQPSGFTGIDGIFRFRPDGTTDRGLAVYEFADGQARLIEGPPPTFDALTQ